MVIIVTDLEGEPATNEARPRMAQWITRKAQARPALTLVTVCMMGSVATVAEDVCVVVDPALTVATGADTMHEEDFPSELPATGGAPVKPPRWPWMGAVLLLITAGTWMAIRQTRDKGKPQNP